MINSKTKTLLLILMLAVCLMLVSGCSFSNVMNWGSGVQNDPDYRTWERLSENGKLDSEGKYTADAVHVTFARNGYVNMHYYSDAARNNELPATGCHLLPGDTIFFSYEMTDEANNLCAFDHLEVIEYSSENVRKGILDWPSGSEENTSLMIPYDYKGTEISIEPCVQFGERQFVLKDTVKGKEKANGVWKINKKQVSGNSFSANPLESYTVEYEYDANRYYLININPAPWNTDESSGLAVFKMSGPKTGVETYEINLDSYISAELSVSSGEIINVRYIDENSGAVQRSANRNNNQSYTAPGIKVGSVIEVTTTAEKPIDVKCDISYKETQNDKKVNNGKVSYIHTIEFGTKQFMFNPSDYAYAHGKLRFTWNGQELTGAVLLNSGMEIYYEATETEEGYWLPENGPVKVNGPDTEKELRNIRFYPYRKVIVLLDQPEAGGRILYKSNEQLTGNSAEVYCGSKIHMEFIPDPGWQSRMENGFAYTVSEAENQTAGFGGRMINEIFEELEGHKPKLHVEINRNMGECETTVTASGIKHENVRYKNNNTIINEEKAGTDQDIQLVFRNLDFTDQNNALRIIVEKETTKGGYKDIYYTNKAGIPIQIPFAKDKWYKTVTIKIEAVKADTFQLNTMQNTEWDVRFSDVTSDDLNQSPVISPGSLITDERQLILTITPYAGYYMTGSDTKNEIYQRRLNYDTYRKLKITDLQGQLKKKIRLNLLTEDPYGRVIYRIDEKRREGEVLLREDQDVVIVYDITNPQYEIPVNIFDRISGNNETHAQKSKKAKDFKNINVRRSDMIEVRRKVSK